MEKQHTENCGLGLLWGVTCGITTVVKQGCFGGEKGIGLEMDWKTVACKSEQWLNSLLFFLLCQSIHWKNIQNGFENR